MALITQQQILRSYNPPFAKSMNESVSEAAATRLKRSATKAFSITEHYDIFLCHAFKDAQYVEAIKEFLESHNLTVYVDWIDDPQLNRAHVTPATAAKLRAAMRRSTSLIYAASVNASASKWMPWELGYSDAFHGRVAILPLADENKLVTAYEGQEFMGIYPYVDDDESGKLLLNSQQESKNVPIRTWLQGSGNSSLQLIKG
ncbi:TIR domain-containing protein [Hymenobacter sp.]|jgi:hypothetical protein|uniref:TIR domain-containing protein n=1 Tax=Hymenobacter sp. TaxID=1898978 RepID=UPI002ED845D6